MESFARERSRSRSPPPWRRQTDRSRFSRSKDGSRNATDSGRGRGRGNFQNQYQRRNQQQEDRQMREWMLQEDDFVLKQSKKKSKIRIKEGRSKLIDKLVLVLSIVDPAKDLLEDDVDDLELEIRSPIDLIEESSTADLQELEKEVEHYLVLEHSDINRTFWESIQTARKGRLGNLVSQGSARGVGPVSSDIDRLLESKTMEQLRILESQVHEKLQSNEAIDEEYWEQLLESIGLYKARAHLKEFSNNVSKIRLNNYRQQQLLEAQRQKGALENARSDQVISDTGLLHADKYETQPRLKLLVEDQSLEVIDDHQFRECIARTREKISNSGYIAASNRVHRSTAASRTKSLLENKILLEDGSSVMNLMYDREAAKGVEEDEEVFAGEAEVAIESKPIWSGKYRPRKPKHFNRVQMGYEWNKYNQTHYDHDNPPPKVVQGYKFNIFYPDLIDTTKAPTYRIERENGRRKGQSLAPAGEEDTCLIRFISGPPYEDIAFRIVDREWDYSAKRERGFKSSFEKGILQLHFQFKKIYYRK